MMEVSGQHNYEENHAPGPEAGAGSKPGGSKWVEVQNKVLVPLRATLNFKTLRDMYGEVMLDPKRLKFVSELGEGNYCTVAKYEYTDESGLKSFVAVKKLKPGTVSAQEMLDFMREVKILKKLRHSRIANFRGTGYLPAEGEDGEEAAFLAQELVEGGSLRSLLERQILDRSQKLYTLTEALTWLLDVALGLKYLHQAEPQIIHRDLKPENILLTLNREARVVDFGLHKVIDKWDKEGANEGDQMFEMTGGTGALMYMPPEAMVGTKYNHKVDVFSFAIIAWELVHYEMLIARISNSRHHQDDLRSYAKFVARQDYRPPISTSTLPKSVADLICDCWKREPSARPEFEELVPRLKMIIEEVSAAEKASSNAQDPPARNWFNRNKKKEKSTSVRKASCWGGCFSIIR